ncbi:MAG: hypothetical protein IIC73_04710 [Armatimonadetes bacterium]|nr:hypothetical protein [Armatimonadota bacterium]
MTFGEREKNRLVALKPVLFSRAAQPAGTYSGKPRSFCLADDRAVENIHPLVRDAMLEYFKSRGIAWHRGEGQPTNHLCSSQVACINTLGPMMTAPDLLADAFRPYYPDLAEPLPLDADGELPGGGHPFLGFEWIGTQSYLGERNWGTRGVNCTSTDFVFRFRSYDHKIHLVLGEWKYTEEYPRSLPKPADINRTRWDTYADLYSRWAAACGDSVPPYETLFVEPFYQLMRQTLLAKEMERARGSGPGEMEADVVSVLHVSPQANREFAQRFTSPSLAQYGRTVTEAWTRIDCPEKFLAISSESLLTSVELAAGANHAEWAEWLLLRYGWWRQ